MSPPGDDKNLINCLLMESREKMIYLGFGVLISMFCGLVQGYLSWNSFPVYIGERLAGSFVCVHKIPALEELRHCLVSAFFSSQTDNQ